MEIFVNGIQRSGTNYLTSILELNTNLDVSEYDNLHWKHDICKYDLNGKSNKKSIITIIKNPYTWVESICYRNRVDIIEYHSNHNLTYNHGMMINDINLENLILLYKSFYDSWYTFGTKVVKYEYLLNQRNIKKFLYKEHNIISKIPIIPEKVSYSDYFIQENVNYYQKQETIYLEKKHIQKINDILTNDFFIRYNYNINN
jgi:uncharacterized protein YuzB (UPF0349 family)